MSGFIGMPVHRGPRVEAGSDSPARGCWFAVSRAGRWRGGARGAGRRPVGLSRGGGARRRSGFLALIVRAAFGPPPPPVLGLRREAARRLCGPSGAPVRVACCASAMIWLACSSASERIRRAFSRASLMVAVASASSRAWSSIAERSLRASARSRSASSVACARIVCASLCCLVAASISALARSRAPWRVASASTRWLSSSRCACCSRSATARSRVCSPLSSSRAVSPARLWRNHSLTTCR